MSKKIALSQEQLVAVSGIESFVVTGITPDAFTIASGETVVKVQGELDGLKVADKLSLKDGVLELGKAIESGKKHNPSPEVLAKYDF